MTETEVRQELVKKIRAVNCIAQPIESGITGIGIPDLFIRTFNTSCWCEVKIAYFKKGFVQLKWRPGQIPWLSSYNARGGKILLAVGFESKQGEALALFEWPHFLQYYMGDDFSELAHEIGELKPFEGSRLVSIIDNL